MRFIGSRPLLTCIAFVLLLPIAGLCADADGDGIDDSIDNCPYAFNPDQADSDSNGIGDQCDFPDCGDVDGSGGVYPADILYLYKWLFEGGPAPVDMLQANVGGCEGINVYDVTTLTALLFIKGQFRPSCDIQIPCTPSSVPVAISIDHVDGQLAADTVQADSPLTFYLRLTNATYRDVMGLSNGFRIYSPTGVDWDTAYISPSVDWSSPIRAFDRFGTNSFGVTGEGSDTVALFAASFLSRGMIPGYDSVAYSITVGPIDRSFSGGTICIDSAWFPPSNDWMWSRFSGDNYFEFAYPSWGGPYCYTIYYCCDPRGDVDRSGGINVSDLTMYVAYLFQGGTAPACTDQADVDADGTHNVSDLTYLVAYLFQGGSPPPPCQ